MEYMGRQKHAISALRFFWVPYDLRLTEFLEVEPQKYVARVRKHAKTVKKNAFGRNIFLDVRNLTKTFVKRAVEGTELFGNPPKRSIRQICNRVVVQRVAQNYVTLKCEKYFQI